jgi:hypothetical protein
MRMSDDPKKGEPTSFTPPAEEVQDQVRTAASYSERVKEGQAATSSLKGKGKPLGGAPPIPKGKMAALTQPMQQPEFGEEPPPEAQPEKDFRVPQEPPQLGGVGSGYGVNQAMARGETGGKPVSMKEAKEQDFGGPKKKPISDETMTALAAAKESMDKGGEEPEPEGDDTRERLDDADSEIADRESGLDFGAIMGARSSLMSTERKKRIEDRLEPLDISEMISKREIQQEIPIVPNKLHVTLRTYSQREYLFCLRHVYEFPGSAAFVEELLNTCKMVCSVEAINGAHLPSHLDKDGEVDRELFQKKYHHVTSFPINLLADFSVQCIWFGERVNELFGLDNLKNG